MSSKKLNYILSGLVVLAIAFILFDNYYLDRHGRVRVNPADPEQASIVVNVSKEVNANEDKMVSREKIEDCIKTLNEAENKIASVGIDKSIAQFDELRTSDGKTWSNGEQLPDTGVVEMERMLFNDVPDYHREIDRVIIDPSFAAFSWRITGTSKGSGEKLNVVGASHVEFTDDGKMKNAWLFVND